MDIVVYNRAGIERLSTQDCAHIIISITTSFGDRAPIPDDPMRVDLLRLSFVDLDRPDPMHPEYVMFCQDHALQIWNTVMRHKNDIERIIVHCDAGLSRSPAVAAAIARVLTGSDTKYFQRYRPNMRVYRTLLDFFENEIATYESNK